MQQHSIIICVYTARSPFFIFCSFEFCSKYEPNGVKTVLSQFSPANLFSNCCIPCCEYKITIETRRRAIFFDTLKKTKTFLYSIGKRMLCINIKWSCVEIDHARRCERRRKNFRRFFFHLIPEIRGVTRFFRIFPIERSFRFCLMAQSIDFSSCSLSPFFPFREKK